MNRRSEQRFARSLVFVCARARSSCRIQLMSHWPPCAETVAIVSKVFAFRDLSGTRAGFRSANRAAPEGVTSTSSTPSGPGIRRRRILRSRIHNCHRHRVVDSDTSAIGKLAADSLYE